MNKFELTRRLILQDIVATDHKKLRLLDVGCRGCELQDYIGQYVDYEGLDLFQNNKGTVRHVIDLSKGLPFPDATYDCVVALDVLEHIDNMQASLYELFRVTKRKLVVMLPNMGHLFFRWKMLYSGKLNEKYDLSYDMGPDRHRWFTVQTQADEFMRNFARANGLSISVEYWFDISAGKSCASRIAKSLGFSPNVWAWAMLYVLEKKPSEA